MNPADYNSGRYSISSELFHTIKSVARTCVPYTANKYTNVCVCIYIFRYFSLLKLFHDALSALYLLANRNEHTASD